MAKTPTFTFYVYRILGEQGETVYIGKGTGRRLQQQKRRFQADGEVLRWCRTEDSAYRCERELIAHYNPPLNKSPGGNGSRYGQATSGPALFAGIARIIRRLGGLEPSARAIVTKMLSEIAQSMGLRRFKAGLIPCGIELVECPASA